MTGQSKTQVDLSKIQREVERILVHSQNYPFDLNASVLVKEWYEAKKNFIEAFGGNTVLRSPVTVKVDLSEEQRSERFSMFMDMLKNNEVLTDELEAFLWVNKDGFFDNSVKLPYASKNIPRGSKLSKSFRKFLTDEETIRWVQDMASRFIQENKIEGYLYLSIDPRDYLTLSDNGERWWTCHSLDGDYRAGNLNYMVDKCTIVAYIANEKPKTFRGLPYNMKWFSKRWRILIHINKNIIYYNRQYPFSSPELLEETYKILNDTLNLDMMKPQVIGTEQVVLGDDANNIVPLSSNYIYLDGEIFSSEKIINTEDFLGFEDIIFSSIFYPSASMPKDFFSGIDTDEKIKIKIGEKAPCPKCGRRYLDKSTSFLCETCRDENDAEENFYTECCNCGRRLYTEEETIRSPTEELYYCKSCYKACFEEEE